MRLTPRVLCLAVCLAAPSTPPAVAQQGASIKVGTPLDLTAVYTFVSSEYSQGQRDYAALVNARGGIKGQQIEVVVSDTGNQPQRGIEAYERLKNEGSFVVDFLSTPVSRAVAPRALADGINVITMFHGRSDALDGKTFPTLFPLSPNYWSQAATIIDYLQNKAGGSLKGKKIAYVMIDSPFGREPLPVLETLAKQLGYELSTFPYPSPGNEQGTVWTQVRRLRPDYIIVWGAGTGQTVSLSTALRNGVPLDQIVSVIWLSETDINVVGAQQAKGVMRFEGVASGRDLPIIKALATEVYGKGKGNGPAERIGSSYYNIGVASMALIGEAARIALETEGAPLTAAKLKKGFESIKDYTAEGLLPRITISPEDHGGGGLGRIAAWDGAKWVPQSDWAAPYSEIVWDLVRKSAEEYRASGK